VVGVIAVGGPNLGFTGGGFDLLPIVVAAFLLLVARTVAGLRIGLVAVVASLLVAPLLEAAGDRIGYAAVAAIVLAIALLIARIGRPSLTI